MTLIPRRHERDYFNLYFKIFERDLISTVGIFTGKMKLKHKFFFFYFMLCILK
jgi:hypothetical protein